MSNNTNEIEFVDSSEQSNATLKEFIDDTLDEATIKKLLFKYSKNGNATKFSKYFEQLPPRLKIRTLVKPDPELKSILHHLLLNSNHDILSYLLENHSQELSFASITLETNPAPHLALALFGFPNLRERCLKTFLLLLDFLETANALDINIPDRLGRTFLHLACMYGCTQLIDELSKRNCDYTVTDREGQTAEDYCIEYRQWGAMKKLYELQGYFKLNKLRQCVERDSWECFAYLWTLNPGHEQLECLRTLAKERNRLTMLNDIVESWDAHQNLEMMLKIAQAGTNSSTLIISDSRMLNHAGFAQYSNVQKRVQQKTDQPENAERLMVLIDQERGMLTQNQLMKDNGCLIRSPNNFYEKFTIFMKIFPNFFLQKYQHFLVKNIFYYVVCLLTCDKASLSDIIRVHDYNYLHKILQQTKKTPNESTLSAEGTQRFDRDTVLSQHTWEVSLLSAGAVLKAVDSIMAGSYTNAFCAVRPPGHHSGVYGKTNHHGVEKLCNKEHLTNGFCFINNVAVAAGYAKYRYREKVKRVAIVDMDVHHGNGTQEIVESNKQQGGI